MAIEHSQNITVEEYFQLEESDPDTRYEYSDGQVYAMAGGTANHDVRNPTPERAGACRDGVVSARLLCKPT